MHDLTLLVGAIGTGMLFTVVISAFEGMLKSK